MAEELYVNAQGSKAARYQALLPQLKGLLEGEPDLVANLANLTAALKQSFDWLWVGFYLVKNEQLVLGPFQGPIACTRIAYGKGVCGTAWKEAKTQLVPDVAAFPGHIACSSDSRSEIVIPILVNQNVVAVLDIDSAQLAEFDTTDQAYLEEIAALVGKCFLSA
ncbi:MAG: GAF domain-containing protein [Bacteroidetes bacterium]|nr:MAG: GAF domain-containing protein [Bacteroidota bacterium]